MKTGWKYLAKSNLVRCCGARRLICTSDQSRTSQMKNSTRSLLQQGPSPTPAEVETLCLLTNIPTRTNVPFLLMILTDWVPLPTSRYPLPSIDIFCRIASYIYVDLHSSALVTSPPPSLSSKYLLFFFSVVILIPCCVII